MVGPFEPLLLEYHCALTASLAHCLVNKCIILKILTKTELRDLFVDYFA